MKRRKTTLLPVLMGLTTLGGLSCGTESEGTESSGTKSAGAKPSAIESTFKGHHLASVSFPLFPEDAEAKYGQLRKARQAAGLPETTLTDAIPWAKTIDEAFERATKEDKPLLLVTFVRENGDPACDV